MGRANKKINLLNKDRFAKQANYLDTHPEDQSMVTLFNDYRKKKAELTREYEESYGPLTVGSDVMEGNTYSWIHSPWPWEGII